MLLVYVCPLYKLLFQGNICNVIAYFGVFLFIREIYYISYVENFCEAVLQTIISLYQLYLFCRDNLCSLQNFNLPPQICTFDAQSA